MMKRPALSVLALLLSAGLVSACQETIPKEALELSHESLQRRQLQSRIFETKDEGNILSASAAVMQDLGFTIDESHSPLGLVVGSKDRDATEAGQVAGMIFVALLTGAAMPIDKNQKIRVSVVTRPLTGDRSGVVARVTFQRIVWNNRGQVSRTEPLDEPQLYQEFFEKLSKSVFLEANPI